VSGTRRAAAALLALAAAGPAAAFVRSTTDANSPTAGKCLWWNTKAVTYRLNTSGFAGSACAQGPGTLARASFPAWSTPACTDFSFVDGGDTATTAIGFNQGGSNENTVVVRKGACDDTAVVPGNDACHGSAGACSGKYNCWEHTGAGNARTIALTTTTFRASTGEIVDADMELFGWDGVSSGTLLANSVPPSGWYFSCGTSGPPCTAYGGSSCLYMDLGGTMTHEAGHMLGLDHVCVYAGVPSSTCFPSAVMAATATTGDVSKRTLTSDDADGVCAIYPAGKPPDQTTGCLSSQSQGSTSTGSGGGCATAGAGELGLLVLAALALRRRHATIAPA